MIYGFAKSKLMPIEKNLKLYMPIDGQISGNNMRCAWLELSTSRAYRDETGLSYRICKQIGDSKLGLCPEHQGRLEAMGRRTAYFSLRYFEKLSHQIFGLRS